MRKFILLSSGLLFIIVAAGLVLIGSGEGNSMFIIMSSAAVPFLFTGYWNVFSVYFESKANLSGEYFTFKENGKAGIGVFYNKVIAVPFFLVLFGSACLAIITSFFALSPSTEDAAVTSAGAGSLYSLIITIYYTKKICRGAKDPNTHQAENPAGDNGLKIALFFAGIATLGLLPLVYYVYKSIKGKKDAAA